MALFKNKKDMEIKDNWFLSNRTRELVLPIIKSYGKEYINMFTNVFKLGVGIGDHVIPHVKNALFLLVDTENQKVQFIKFLEWAKEQDEYIMDYAFDDIEEGHMHIFVFKIPEKVYMNFAKSSFSNMYTGEQIKELFNPKKPMFTILTRSKEAVKLFVDMINKEFNTEYDPDEWDGEIMYPIKSEEETF